jgi:hypothetical protein
MNEEKNIIMEENKEIIAELMEIKELITKGAEE